MTPLSSTSLILAINPGSTSTKIALFSGKKKLAQKTLHHSDKDLQHFDTIWQQFDFRAQAIDDFLTQENFYQQKFSGVVGRGGLLKPLHHGTYRVTQSMIRDAKRGVQGQHISNLGCALAEHFAKKLKCHAYVVDPVSVDEFQAIARLSGHPLIQRRALSHALNIRAATFHTAQNLELNVFQSNMIVAHLGGGISIAAVEQGRIIDVNDASSDGPFSPDRTGGLPLQPFIELCFAPRYSIRDIKEMVMGKGGLMAYLGTNDLKVVEEKIDQGDACAKEVYQAMAYQIAKEIGAMATVLLGKIDAIVFTGGLSHSKRLIELIQTRIGFLAPVQIIPGEMEMEAMSEGLLRVLNGEENLQTY
ncbi:butyrate kinase [candidate division KSB1 bacterium]|nr:butyrate kinase [candidate division KSB1 bacterium]